MRTSTATEGKEREKKKDKKTEKTKKQKKKRQKKQKNRKEKNKTTKTKYKKTEEKKKITKRHQIKNVNTMFAVLCNVEVKEVFNNTQMFASGFDSSRSKKIIRLCVVKKCFCFL